MHGSTLPDRMQSDAERARRNAHVPSRSHSRPGVTIRFAIKIETRCREWEKGKFFDILFGNRRDRRVRPIIRIRVFMEYILRDAVRQCGYIVELFDLP